MKKLLLLSAVLLLSSCSKDNVSDKPITHECTTHKLYEERAVLYDAYTNIVSDSGWKTIEDLGEYSYDCSDDGKIITTDGINLTSMIVIYKRFRIVKI